MEPQLLESQKILDQAKTLGITGKGVTDLSKVVDAKTLSGETPINLPPAPTSTFAGAITGKTEAILELDALEQKAAQERADREAKLQESETTQKSLLERIGFTKKEETERGREEFGLDVLEPIRLEATKKLRASQVAQLAEIKALDQQPGTLEQKAQRQADINRKYGLDQLTYQLQYNLANSDITAAEETINDRIALVTEPLYQQLDLQEKVYDQIRDSLSKSEDREWSLALEGTRQAIKETEDLENYRGKIAITYNQNNGKPLPSYVQAKINRAKNRAEVDMILSENGISLAKPKEGGDTPTGKPLSINQIEQFRRSYGWTPPFGFTQAELLQFMKDNPNASPEELEAGAKLVGQQTSQSSGGTSGITYQGEKFIDAGVIEREFPSLDPKKAMSGVESYRSQGYNDLEIYNFLKNAS